jgi:hypothetical protein
VYNSVVPDHDLDLWATRVMSFGLLVIVAILSTLVFGSRGALMLLSLPSVDLPAGNEPVAWQWSPWSGRVERVVSF